MYPTNVYTCMCEIVALNLSMAKHILLANIDVLLSLLSGQVVRERKCIMVCHRCDYIMVCHRCCIMVWRRYDQ